MQYKKILKIGSSKGVIIPAAWCRQLDFKLNDYVALEVLEENKIALHKVDRKYYTAIRNLVINAGNGDIDYGVTAKS